MKFENLREEMLVKATMSVAKAMEFYAKTGEEDFAEIGPMLNLVMIKIAKKMSVDNLSAFHDWLGKKCKDLEEEEKEYEEFIRES